MPGGSKAKKKAAGAARGFATVSVQKKVTPSTEEASEPAAEISQGSPLPNDSATESPEPETKVDEQVEELDPEQTELQNLVERLKPGCDKEIARLLKIIDYDQRLSKTFPVFTWRETALKEDILRLARGEDERTPLTPVPLEQQEKLLSRMIVFHAILERLGVIQTRIEACLRTVRHVELEDIFDWLALHCDESDLEFSGPRQVERPPHVFIDKSAAPRRSSSESLMASSSMSSSLSLPQTPPMMIPDSPITPTAKQIPIADPFTDVSLTSGFDASLEENPVGAYVAAKLELLSLSRRSDESLERRKALLEAKLKSASQKYSFDEQEAEAAFRVGRAKIDAEALRERLNHPSEKATIDKKGIANTAPFNAVKADVQSTVAGDTSLFGNLLDEPAVGEVTSDGKIIRTLDMSLPPKWSAKPPQGLLKETLQRIDQVAVATYRVISDSRAVRATVSIRWGNGRLDEYGMSDVACQDQKQAFNYVATLALFPIATTPVHRQLSANFRDLWDELASKKQAEEAREYREHVKALRALADLRLTDGILDDKKTIAKPPVADTSHITPMLRTFAPSDPSMQLHQAFIARTESQMYQEMLRYRATLPIAAYREIIVESVAQNQVLILCGETGCGKSTQLPAFLLEQWLQQGRQANILCTEPRRISAISLAQRVSRELGDLPGSCGNRGSLVGYHVRLEARTSPTTRLVYATTGIALRMLEGDTALEGLTHLIIDEVHERTIDSDFLMISLKELLQRRPDLRLILMSATVDSEKLSEYWNGCPIINVPGRTFPVSPFFLEDVIELCGYRLEPDSDSPYARRLRRDQAPRQAALDDELVMDSDEEAVDAVYDLGKRYSKQTKTTLEIIDEHQINFELIVMLVEALCFKRSELLVYSGAILIFLPSLESIRRLTDMLEAHEVLGGPGFHIFPLHSTISNDNQTLVFNPMPTGVRKIVIATNIAETGITIPDITCVIDSGRHREMIYDEKRQISRLVETYIARSNASQRRGRAGRVQEGLAFAMFTKHRHDQQFADHPQPEMLRLSLQDLALRIKVLEFKGTIAEVFLRALDPPALNNIERAIAALVEVKALTGTEDITALGRYLAKLPVDVHLGKLLLLGGMFGCLDAALTIVSALNAKSPWLTPFNREAEADAAKRSFKVENSDFLTLVKAFGSWRESCKNGVHQQFTRKAFLSHQTLSQVEELRLQFFNLLIESGFAEAAATPFIQTKARIRFLQVPEAFDRNSADPRVVMAVVGCAMFPKVLVNAEGGGWKTLINSAPTAVHPTSVNFNYGRRPDFGQHTRFVAYFNIMQSKRLYVWENGPVEEQAVMSICGGEADFKIAAHTVTIDRNRVRACADARTLVMLKRLRAKYSECLSAKLKGKEWTPSQVQWWSLICRAIATPAREKRERDKEVKPMAGSIAFVKNS